MPEPDNAGTESEVGTDMAVCPLFFFETTAVCPLGNWEVASR